jgi:hypothetical protein
MLLNKLQRVHYQTAIFLQLKIQTSKLFMKLKYLYEGFSSYCKHIQFFVGISKIIPCIMTTEDSNDTETLSTEQSPPWRANGHSASHKVPRLLWNLKIHYIHHSENLKSHYHYWIHWWLWSSYITIHMEMTRCVCTSDAWLIWNVA